MSTSVRVQMPKRAAQTLYSPRLLYNNNIIIIILYLILSLFRDVALVIESSTQGDTEQNKLKL